MVVHDVICVCFEGTMLEPCFLKPCFHVAGREPILSITINKIIILIIMISIIIVMLIIIPIVFSSMYVALSQAALQARRSRLHYRPHN